MGSVKVYYLGTKTFNTKNGPVPKTVCHYESNGVRYAFASNRKDFVDDMKELAALMAKPDGKQTSIEADFSWPKGGTLSVTVP